MYLLKTLFGFILFSFLFSCKEQVQVSPTTQNKFADIVFREIANFQDQRDSPSLISYLSDTNSKYREAACYALASVQKIETLQALTEALSDKSAGVRVAASYALGQLKSTKAVDSLLYGLAWEKVPFVRKELIKALGKSVDSLSISELSDIEVSHNLEKEGMAWALYYAALKNPESIEMVWKAIDLLAPSNTYQTRLGAIHFLTKTNKLGITSYFDIIKNIALNDTSANIRMAATTAIGLFEVPKATETLVKIALNDTSNNVKISALKALANHEYDETKELLWKSVLHKNPHISYVAAQVIGQNVKDSLTEIINNIDQVSQWRTKAELMEAAIVAYGNGAYEKTITLFNASDNIYEKAAYLKGLSHSIKSIPLLDSIAFGNNHALLKTAAITGLKTARSLSTVDAEIANNLGEVFKRAVESGDVSLIAIGAEALATTGWNYKEQFADYSFLLSARDSLTMPKNLETFYAIENTINIFENKSQTSKIVPEYNHPIDWDIVAQLGKDEKMLIKTSKGDIAIRMLVEDSPGSVADFLNLAMTGKYDNINIHRVVPNFVMQAGCERGDGWGSENHTIRSELGPRTYGQGYVGMASAGKDTESAQWFITHAPTPHLDGSYTIFAVVTKGMDVVQKLEVGDQIISVQLNDAKGILL